MAFLFVAEELGGAAGQDMPFPHLHEGVAGHVHHVFTGRHFVAHMISQNTHKRSQISFFALLGFLIACGASFVLMASLRSLLKRHRPAATRPPTRGAAGGASSRGQVMEDGQAFPAPEQREIEMPVESLSTIGEGDDEIPDAFISLVSQGSAA